MSILILVAKVLAGLVVSFAVGLFIGQCIRVGQGTRRNPPWDNEDEDIR